MSEGCPPSAVATRALLVDKTIAYEAPSDTTYKSDFLLLGEVISPSDYDPGDYIITDGADFLQSVYNQYFGADPDINTIRLYENYPRLSGILRAHDGDGCSTAMNAGVNHVIHAGHGGKYNMSVGRRQSSSTTTRSI